MFHTLSNALVALLSLTAAILIPISAYGQAGAPDRCPRGLVWREAYAGDQLCVTPEERVRSRGRTDRACSPGAERQAGDACRQTSPGLRDAIKDPFSGINAPRPFLIIAPDEFVSVSEPLVAHKNSTGMPTVLITISQLTSYFPGVDNPEKVKRGIQYAHEHLGTRYVMLAGDAHWFPVRYTFFQNFSRAYPNHIGEANLPVDGVYAPSDFYYANLYHHRIVRDGGLKALPGTFASWDDNRNSHYNEVDWGINKNRTDWNNPNPDRVDGYADVAVGRLVAHSATDVTIYVNKVIKYETQRPKERLFTFVADGNYPQAPRHVDAVVANSRLNVSASFLQINKDDRSATARWTIKAPPELVASKISLSTWVGYLGHGSQHSWNGPGFNASLVKMTANNDALPVVFTDGCVTGRFAPEAPFDYEYADVNAIRHQFVPAPGADPRNPSVPALLDKATGETWGARCTGCKPLPLITPRPNPYDLDRGNFNFAYPWLFTSPGGAIAYFGHIGVMEYQMAAELETYMLADYVRGERVLGALYLQGEQEYWQHHINDPGITDHHSPSRLYLGFMVMFGDPSLRMH